MPRGRPRKITKGVIEYTSADQRLIFQNQDKIQEVNGKVFELEMEIVRLKSIIDKQKAVLTEILRKEDTYLTPEEAADYCCVSLSTFYNYEREGRIRKIRYKTKGRRYGYGFSRFELDKLNAEMLNLHNEGGNEVAYNFCLDAKPMKVLLAEERKRRQRMNNGD